MSKKTYAELLAENAKLTKKLEELQFAMKQADRHPLSYDAHRWIAIPLHAKQVDGAKDHFSDRLSYACYKEVDGERHWEEVHESDVLPEYKQYLIRFTTDIEGNMLSGLKIWGLEPI